MRRVATYFLLLILVLVGVVAGWLYWRTHVCLPQLDGTVAVSGLSARVEVLRDARGVPHIRGQSIEDAMFAQGYVTAQDRFWQMDLNRRLAHGELSEVFGERTLRLDIENRMLGFHKVCERAVRESDEETRKVFAAYARGVNAYMSSHRDRLPIEFALLGYEPRPWREADSVGVALNMAKTLNTTWDDDLMRERIRAKVSPELYADLFPERSPLDHPIAEPVAAPTASPEQLPAARSVEPGGFDSILAGLKTLEPADAAPLGSNNWVVSGARTQSGRPLLANDPHLSHGVPSVWYMIHVKAPGLNVTGASLPGLPAVIIGHNERIAWGATNTGPDVQDLYIESFNFREPDKYLHYGRWMDAEVREEVIKVRNGRDYTFTVRVTQHGPVISEEGNRDLALRWTALEPGALNFPFLRIAQARNWPEFTAALRDFASPMQNFVYADVDGNIGFYAAGWVPIRRKGDGTVPARGSIDDFDWTGYIPFEELPHALNPASGVVATANARVVPDDYPYLITRQWAEPYRTARIFELLEAGSRFTVTDMLRIQTDIRSLEDLPLAKHLLKAGETRPPRDPEAQYALSLLPNWDGEARADSAAMLVCRLTRRAALERILGPKLGDNLSGYRWPMSSVFLENVLTERPARWLPPDDADFNQTLIRSLETAVARIPELVGSRDRAAWRWGETIPVTFYHPLGRASPWLGHLLDVGPFPQSGTGSTIKAANPDHGVSMRMVVDLGDLDNSVQNITLGESGQLFSPHYRDQFEAWYEGRSFPMPFSDAAVEKAAAHRLVLEPGP